MHLILLAIYTIDAIRSVITTSINLFRMKKSIVCILTLSMGVALSAQTFNVGLKGGYEAAFSSKNILQTDLISSSVSQVKSGFASGYQVGGWMRLGGKKIFFQPELLLNVKKTTQTFNVGGTTQTGTYKTQAIEVPLLIGYRVLSVGPLAVRLNAGPKVVFDAGSSSTLSHYANVVSQDFKDASWAADGGIGVDLMSISLDLRYSQYFTNTYRVTFNNNQVVNTKGNKQSLYLTLGWRLF
ncbi:MAG: hypothetical protein H6Q17_1257 [Bacteroidetes bacterium]|nr:hypothetical protein [Bacteroidota bacterium]